MAETDRARQPRLKDYYERELSYLRQMGRAFKERYPAIAARLELEEHISADPHVERLLEGFAFLAARVHMKLDDGLPELTESFLGLVYPHFVRPVPGMGIVQMVPAPGAGMWTSGITVARDAVLTTPTDPPCTFRTCYRTELWPLDVHAVRWQGPGGLDDGVPTRGVAAVLRLELRTAPDVSLAQLGGLRSLRFHLSGDPHVSHSLYELLRTNCTGVLARALPGAPARRPVMLPGSAIRPVGFAPDESMLPRPRNGFAAFQLLQEYFAFPAKYLFLDLDGFDQIRAQGHEAGVELFFLVAPFERPERGAVLERGVGRDTFRLGCTPVVNLFEKTSEAVRIVDRRDEYPLVPDRRRADIEIYSVDGVSAVELGAAEAYRIEPFYSHRHHAGARGEAAFWHVRHRPRVRDDGISHYLAFADLAGRLVHPRGTSAVASLTCYNGTIPERLTPGLPEAEAEVQRHGALRARLLARPTAPQPAPHGGELLWRYISLLSMSYTSLVEGPDALREVLELHAFMADPAEKEKVRHRIAGIQDVRSEPAYSRVTTEHGLAFARGRRVRVVIDEEHFGRGGAYLMASVLDHFFGLFTSLNSFSMLDARTAKGEALGRWPARAGWKALL